MAWLNLQEIDILLHDKNNNKNNNNNNDDDINNNDYNDINNKKTALKDTYTGYLMLQIVFIKQLFIAIYFTLKPKLQFSPSDYLKWYYSPFSLQKFGCNCYLF